MRRNPLLGLDGMYTTDCTFCACSLVPVFPILSKHHCAAAAVLLARDVCSSSTLPLSLSHRLSHFLSPLALGPRFCEPGQCTLNNCQSSFPSFDPDLPIRVRMFFLFLLRSVLCSSCSFESVSVLPVPVACTSSLSVPEKMFR